MLHRNHINHVFSKGKGYGLYPCWYGKTRVTISELQVVNYELLVARWKLKATSSSSKVLFPIPDWRVQIHKFKFRSYKFNSQATSSNEQVTSSKLQVTTSISRVTSSYLPATSSNLRVRAHIYRLRV